MWPKESRPMYPYIRSKDITKMQKIMKSVTRWVDRMGVISRKQAAITRKSVTLRSFMGVPIIPAESSGNLSEWDRNLQS